MARKTTKKRTVKPREKLIESDALRRRREAFDLAQSQLARGGPNDWQVVRGKLRHGIGAQAPVRIARKRQTQTGGPTSSLAERRLLDPIESPEGQAFIADFVKRLETAQRVAHDLGAQLGLVTDRYVRECKQVIERYVVRLKRENRDA